MKRHKILLLGSGELGKEVTIALQRLGQYVIAIDSYKDAPAMQVAHEFEVINMLDGDALDAIVSKHKPDLIVPEIEAIRDLASKELGLRTANYLYATTFEDFKKAVAVIGIPCVVKPLMSSSGKGQSIIKTEQDIEKSWNYAMEGSRGDYKEVIVEEFIKFNSEITLLTVTQKNGDTLFCPPIGHRQERGDYQESWQPCAVSDIDLKEAQEMAAKVTKALSGAGLWGVEFFLTDKGIYFSELSPRPHDTGMVTLANTQNLSEFELHARAIIGFPIPQIQLKQHGASAVLLASVESTSYHFTGVTDVLSNPNTDVRLFGKPTTRPYRRMGVVLTYDNLHSDVNVVKQRAIDLSKQINVVNQ